MKAKDDFLNRGTFKMQNMDQVLFWKGMWLRNKPLSEVYPTLFNIVRRIDDIVSNVFGVVPPNVCFRRGLVNVN
jgi:hypothetical protein